jgi:hypothetical protein
MISNTDDVIDSRDVIAWIEELKDMLPESAHDVMPGTATEIAEIKAELATLEKLAEEASGSPDWTYGETLIRETYFTDYIEQLIDDCYEMPKELNSGEWPWRHVTVDYEAAAEEAKADYIDCDFGGVTYLIRA